jgi:pimeloyl-ACP methyl ester carboxylesterase
MATLTSGTRRIRYELNGPAGGPVWVLVNGLTQYIKVWEPFREALAAKGFRVATFDLLGQGNSDKPSLFIEQDDQVAVVRDIIDELGEGPIFLAGISFGAVIALRYAVSHSDRIAGLAPMSAFAELTPQLLMISQALRTGLILGGTSYLQDLLFPMNVSDAYITERLATLEDAKRKAWLINDLYALQNLMESFVNFEPLTPQLSAISAPTLILNGEYDFLTPRKLHDSLRRHIANSALVIVPRVYHAFTLEKPALAADLLARFAEDVLAGCWQGDKKVWIAPDEPGGALIPFPAGYDHLRAVPLPPDAPTGTDPLD